MTIEIGLILLQTVIGIVLWIFWRVTLSELESTRFEMRWRKKNYEAREQNQHEINAFYNSRRDRIEKAAQKAITMLRNAIDRNEDKP